MKEHYGLSRAQLEYLNGRKPLPNESKERERMRAKAEKAWSIFEPILRSNVVSQEYKDSLFSFKRFDDFLNSLLATERTNPSSKELNKMEIAKTMIQKGFQYYQTRYDLNPLIYNEIEKIRSLLEMIDSLVKQELENIKKADFNRTRKGLTSPPEIIRDNYYHALCMECFSYNSGVGHNKDDTILNIRHEPNCSYNRRIKKANRFEIKKINEQFIKITLPLAKKY